MTTCGRDNQLLSATFGSPENRVTAGIYSATLSSRH